MKVIVTAFMSNVNNRKDRSIEDYINCGIKLLSTNLNCIVFMESEVFHKYSHLFMKSEDIKIKVDRYKCITHKNITFVLFEKSDNYLYEYKNIELRVSTNPEKDTLEYMFTQCYKTEWVKIATQISNYEEYVWVDFGIYFMVKNDELFNKIFAEFKERPKHDKIRIATGWDLNDIRLDEKIYAYIRWFFSGSVFGGPPDKLVEFADLTKQVCIDMLTIKKQFMWEVNIWCFVYKLKPELFDAYLGLHDSGIIANY